MLLYPSHITSFDKNDFKEYDEVHEDRQNHACGIGKISIFKDNDGNLVLDDKIGEAILRWFWLLTLDLNKMGKDSTANIDFNTTGGTRNYLKGFKYEE